MKKAKVSSVYEGRGRRRYMGGGREGAANSSKAARMLARARAKILRARKALARTRTMTTRSMSSMSSSAIPLETKKKEDVVVSMSLSTDEPMVINDDMSMSMDDVMKLVIDVDAVEEPAPKEEEEEANNNDNNNNNNNNVETNDNDNKPAEAAEEEKKPALEEEKKKGDDGVEELLTMKDWPMIWTYEEEQIWFRQAYEYGWYPNPEPLSSTAEYWMPTIDHSNETVWNYDDLSTWTMFQDNNNNNNNNNGGAPNP